MDKGSPKPDVLTTIDKHYDESISGLESQIEKMFGLPRTAPSFELRDLEPLLTKDFEKSMGAVDSSIKALHQKLAARRMEKLKRGTNACLLLLPVQLRRPQRL
jgi:hypothetical protein